MLISTRGRYALQVMVDLAEHCEEGWIPLRAVAKRQGISGKYLENILKLLVRQDFVEGIRGKGGGYRLTHPPIHYTVRSILRLTEETLSPVPCLEGQTVTCPRGAACRLLPLWQGLDHTIQTYLEGVTIQDLLLNGTPGDDYVI